VELKTECIIMLTSFIQHSSLKVNSVDEIIEGHQCGFRSNKSTADLISCIRLLLEI
jgi:hypothetical protein